MRLITWRWATEPERSRQWTVPISRMFIEFRGWHFVIDRSIAGYKITYGGGSPPVLSLRTCSEAMGIVRSRIGEHLAKEFAGVDR